MDYSREQIIDIDLGNSGSIHRSFFNHVLGEGDENANRFGIRCFRNGEPFSLSGCTCVGYFIRADKTTVVINGGAISGNMAEITLPDSCYTKPGCFSLAIKIKKGDQTETLRIVDGTVADTTTGEYIDPGTVIPDLADLLAAIEDAEAVSERIAQYSVTAELISGDDYKIIVVTTEE